MPGVPRSAATELGGYRQQMYSQATSAGPQGQGFVDKYWVWICIVVLAALAAGAVWYLWKQNKDNEDKWKTERIAYQQKAQQYGQDLAAAQMAAQRELQREVRTRKGLRSAAGAGVEPTDLAATHDFEVGVHEKAIAPGRAVRTDRWTTGANDQEVEDAMQFDGE